MSFVVKSRQTNLVVDEVTDVEEALIAESAGFRVDAVGYLSVLELAEARCEAMPDYNLLPSQLPEEDYPTSRGTGGRQQLYVRYTSKAGRLMICEVVRLFHPDDEGYPQYLELVNPQRPDGSFVVQATACKVIDLASLSPGLANAILQGDRYEENGGGSTRKIKHGLRKSE
jgi:hypothetical protein